MVYGRYGGAVTPNRGIDADFLDLPRHELAEAALSAATAAGASHADLRVYRINTEIIQLRDGELETAVVNREVGLAVRVIVDGTWDSPRTRSWAPFGRGRDRAPRGTGGYDPGDAEHGARRVGARAGVRRRDLGFETTGSTRSASPRPTRSPCWAGLSGRRLVPTVSTTVGRSHGRQGADVLRRHLRIVDHPAASAGDADAGGGDRRRRGRQLRLMRDAGAADGAGLGSAGRRRGVELDR